MRSWFEGPAACLLLSAGWKIEEFQASRDQTGVHSVWGSQGTRGFPIGGTMLAARLADLPQRTLPFGFSTQPVGAGILIVAAVEGDPADLGSSHAVKISQHFLWRISTRAEFFKS